VSGMAVQGRVPAFLRPPPAAARRPRWNTHHVALTLKHTPREEEHRKCRFHAGGNGARIRNLPAESSRNQVLDLDLVRKKCAMKCVYCSKVQTCTYTNTNQAGHSPKYLADPELPKVCTRDEMCPLRHVLHNVIAYADGLPRAGANVAVSAVFTHEARFCSNASSACVGTPWKQKAPAQT
jgi:hypothetical protein